MAPRVLALALPLSLLLSCATDDKSGTSGDDGLDDTPDVDSGEDLPEPVPMEDGPPVAGMAEGHVHLPIGTPLGGYTSRCKCFGGVSIARDELDLRDSDYTFQFIPSFGVQTRPHVVTLWLENGDQAVLMVKTDIIYSFEGIVSALEQRMTEETGHDMVGKVIVATTHTHAGPSNYDKGMTWFLGGDRYDGEVFERMVGQMGDIAVEAWQSRQDAAIGLGIAKDWDPDNRVYRDRRDDNDELAFFEGIEPGPYKDPWMTLLRVDTAAGEPIGMFYGFGIHGTIEGENNPLSSVEAGAHTEVALAEKFDEPLVVGMWQHGGGDASPAGVDRSFARMESIGDLAADAIYELWEQTPTSSAPISLETVGRAIPTSRDELRVTRNGTTDLHYAPYDPEATPDDVIYDAAGEIISPIDEFNTNYGGAFCGDDEPLIPGYNVGSDIYPYESCVDVDAIGFVIAGFFGLGEPDLPLQESEWASVAASRMGPLPIREPDGTIVEDDVLWAFFPGETTAMYTEQFRRRAAEELGIEHAIPVGYAQDHEGYLLIPEDWLSGGYEASINIWGPLQGEHIMEGLLQLADEHLLTTELREPLDPTSLYTGSVYGDIPQDPKNPDPTPDAGQAAETPPEELWLPFGEDFVPATQPAAELHRVADMAQFIWYGGDPAVDDPEVTIERQEDDGSWTTWTTHAGRPVTESHPDILLLHFPDPLFPSEDLQTHRYWAGWQIVGHVRDRSAVPVGTYRMKVVGAQLEGGSEYPWSASPYELVSESFTVLPAEISLRIEGSTLSAAIEAPSWGFRLVDVEGSSQGANPVREATAVWTLSDTSTTEETISLTPSGGWGVAEISVPEGAVSLSLTDAAGNQGSLELSAG
jgi:neutral ceramidase